MSVPRDPSPEDDTSGGLVEQLRAVPSCLGLRRRPPSRSVHRRYGHQRNGAANVHSRRKPVKIRSRPGATVAWTSAPTQPPSTIGSGSQTLCITASRLLVLSWPEDARRVRKDISKAIAHYRLGLRAEVDAGPRIRPEARTVLAQIGAPRASSCDPRAASRRAPRRVPNRRSARSAATRRDAWFRPIASVRRPRRYDCFHSCAGVRRASALATTRSSRVGATITAAHDCNRPQA